MALYEKEVHTNQSPGDQTFANDLENRIERAFNQIGETIDLAGGKATHIGDGKYLLTINSQCTYSGTSILTRSITIPNNYNFVNAQVTLVAGGSFDSYYDQLSSFVAGIDPTKKKATINIYKAKTAPNFASGYGINFTMIALIEKI